MRCISIVTMECTPLRRTRPIDELLRLQEELFPEEAPEEPRYSLAIIDGAADVRSPPLGRLAALASPAPPPLASSYLPHLASPALPASPILPLPRLSLASSPRLACSS